MIYCPICYRWTAEPFWRHNERHIRAYPHTFCRTIKCSGGCPVRTGVQANRT